MGTYIGLINYTSQGIANIRDTPKRSEDFAASVEALGVEVKDVYWTMGAHDGVLIFSAPDDEAATAAMLSLGARGMAQAQTLRAFDRTEMERILGKL
ncbi:MAG: GYD domain-containing protein [Acidobacteriota bacterium]